MEQPEAGTLRRKMLGAAVAILLACLFAGIGRSAFLLEGGGQKKSHGNYPKADAPEAEFHLGRVMYATQGGAGSHGIIQPWWAVDYPFAEMHFLPALKRLTRISSVAEDSRHLEVVDQSLFDYPFLIMQQPGQGRWNPTPEEAAQFREYFLRGGFMIVDDIHTEYEWDVFAAAMRRVFPDRPWVEISTDDALMHVFYDLDPTIQIPGVRHLRRTHDGRIVAQMEGPISRRGLYDDKGRLMVAVGLNQDMGDAWEHSDTPYYPAEMTGQAYRLGVNYVIYAMTH